MRFYWLEKDNPTAAWGEGVLGLVFTELRGREGEWGSPKITPIILTIPLITPNTSAPPVCPHYVLKTSPKGL